jgi:hypothetical protein
MLSTREEIAVQDIDMDHFGCSNDLLGTTCLNLCVGFIVFLNNNENLFVEHRSDVFFPSDLNFHNVQLCFKNIAKHIHKLSTACHIT